MLFELNRAPGLAFSVSREGPFSKQTNKQIPQCFGSLVCSMDGEVSGSRDSWQWPVAGGRVLCLCQSLSPPPPSVPTQVSQSLRTMSSTGFGLA